jgi:putative two-component system response regulator
LLRHFIKRYSLLVIAQTACLALGLWLEHRFVLSSTPSDGRHNESASAPVASKTAAGALRSDAAILSASPASGRWSAAAMHALALVWIAGLQAAVAYLVLMRDQEEVSRKRSKAERVSLRQYNELLRTRDAVIFGLAKLTESRDSETGNHLERMTIYSTRLASAVRRDPRFRGQVNSSFVKLIGISSVLHDIGKVGVRDAILLKPGKLERQERPQMQLHAAIGGRCIRDIESRLGKSSFLKMAREIAFNHHERWDGLGYPKGLCGEEIPLAARIVAIVDVYDALSTSRVYREALPHERCVEIIRAEAGRQFDPLLVEVFLRLESEFRDIARDCADVRETPDDEPAPESEPPDIAETELPLDETFSVLEAALKHCAGDPPFAAASPQESYHPLAESRDAPAHS